MKIIAHRGNDLIHKENSKKAILKSLSEPFVDGVEFDIRLTKDNKFVINHDPFYHGYYIEKTNSKKLKKEGLTTLEEILDNIKYDKIILIELKTENSNFKKIDKYLYNILKNYNLNIYLCSFNYNFIKYFYNKHNIKCGLIIGKKINQNHLINEFDFNSISYKYKGKIPQKETFRWTINSPKDIENNMQNIITDKTKEIYKYIIDKNI